MRKRIKKGVKVDAFLTELVLQDNFGPSKILEDSWKCRFSHTAHLGRLIF